MAALDTRKAKRAPEYYEPGEPAPRQMPETVRDTGRQSVPGDFLTADERTEPAKNEPAGAVVLTGTDRESAPELSARGMTIGDSTEKNPVMSGAEVAPGEQSQEMTPGERTEAGRRRLLERWNSQILGLGFDLKEFQTSVQEPSAREQGEPVAADALQSCLLYTSQSPRDA